MIKVEYFMGSRIEELSKPQLQGAVKLLLQYIHISANARRKENEKARSKTKTNQRTFDEEALEKRAAQIRKYPYSARTPAHL